MYLQVCSEEDVKNALELTKEKFGKLHHVVNCAGIGVAFKTYNFKKKIPHTLEDFTKTISVSKFEVLYSKRTNTNGSGN